MRRHKTAPVSQKERAAFHMGQENVAGETAGRNAGHPIPAVAKLFAKSPMLSNLHNTLIYRAKSLNTNFVITICFSARCIAAKKGLI